MKLPKEARIGHATYSILEKDAKWYEDTDGKFGHCDFRNLEIAVVTADLPQTQIINTVVHEYLHALFREYSLVSEQEEQIVTCLANGLCQISKDNPEFVKMLGGLSK